MICMQLCHELDTIYHAVLNKLEAKLQNVLYFKFPSSLYGILLMVFKYAQLVYLIYISK